MRAFQLSSYCSEWAFDVRSSHSVSLPLLHTLYDMMPSFMHLWNLFTHIYDFAAYSRAHFFYVIWFMRQIIGWATRKHFPVCIENIYVRNIFIVQMRLNLILGNAHVKYCKTLSISYHRSNNDLFLTPDILQ